MKAKDLYFKEYNTDTGSAYMYACLISIEDGSKIFGQVRVHKRISIDERYVVQGGTVQCFWFTKDVKSFVCHEQRKAVTSFMLDQVILLAENKRSYPEQNINVRNQLAIK